MVVPIHYLCEICENGEVEFCCSGLDTEMLFFCSKCAPIHEEECEAIKQGFARMEKLDDESYQIDSVFNRVSRTRV